MSEVKGSTNSEPDMASRSGKPVETPVAQRSSAMTDSENADPDAAAAGVEGKYGSSLSSKNIGERSEERPKPGTTSGERGKAKTKSQMSRSGVLRAVDKVAVLLAKAAAFGLVAGAVGVAAAYVLREYAETSSDEPDPIIAVSDRVDAVQQDIAEIKNEIRRLTAASESSAEFQSLAAELAQKSDLQAASLETLKSELSGLSESERLAAASSEEQLGGVAARLTALEALVSSFGERVAALENSYEGLSRAASIADGSGQAIPSDDGQNPSESKSPLQPPAGGTGKSGDRSASAFDPASDEVLRIDGEIAALNARLDALSNSKAEASLYKELELRLQGLVGNVEAIESAAAAVQLPPELEGRIEALASQVESMSAEFAAAGGPRSRLIAMVGVRAAAETGAPFRSLLLEAGFAEADLPEIVRTHQETGIATMAELRESFPEASRSAARAAELASDADGIASGIGSLLRSIFQVRPLSPLDGDDPPALLSQAESLVRANRLQDAVNILDRLPEASRLAMNDWHSRANDRLNVLAALDQLANALSGG